MIKYVPLNMYKLYLDKSENFECEVSVKNASLKNSIARLMVECNGFNLAFYGKIQGDKCIIPIKRLKGLLEENDRGNMNLEVIVEDTYFQPWKSEFIVEEHTSVKVRVNEQKQPSSKPIVEVKTLPISKTKKEDTNIAVPLHEISMICKQFKIHKDNLRTRKNDFVQILKEYFNSNPEYKLHRNTILSRIDNLLR